MEKNVFHRFVSLVSVYGQKNYLRRIYGLFLTRDKNKFVLLKLVSRLMNSARGHSMLGQHCTFETRCCCASRVNFFRLQLHSNFTCNCKITNIIPSVPPPRSGRLPKSQDFSEFRLDNPDEARQIRRHDSLFAADVPTILSPDASTL